MTAVKTQTLAEFLLARFAEDKEVASGLQRRAQEHELDCRDPRLLGTVIPGWGDWPRVQVMAAHVVAECEAKRRIVEHYRYEIDEDYKRMPVGPLRPFRALRLLALPYADHPDYREEWRP